MPPRSSSLLLFCCPPYRNDATFRNLKGYLYANPVTDTSTYSTLFLTLLMMIGLFFFIRASTKDRTETLTLPQATAPETTLKDLVHHFEARAYTIHTADGDLQQVSLRGLVRPSVFLAIFLTTLAAVGLVCFALVLASLFPAVGFSFLGLIVLAPAAGLYYWRRARREEQVTVRVEPPDSANSVESAASIATIVAHRDELIALQQTLKQQPS